MCPQSDRTRPPIVPLLLSCFLLLLMAGSRSWAQSCGAVSPGLTQVAQALANTGLASMDGEDYRYRSDSLVFTPKRGLGSVKLPIPLLPDLELRARVTLVSCGASAGGPQSLAYVVVEAGVNDLLGKLVPSPLDVPLRAINPGGAVLVFNLTSAEINLDTIHSSLRREYQNQVRADLGGVTIPGNGIALLMSADVRGIMERTAGNFLSGGAGLARIQFQHAKDRAGHPTAEFRMTLLGRFALRLPGIDNVKLGDPAFIVAKEGADSSTTFSGRFYFGDTALGNAAVSKTAAGYSADIALESLDLGVFSINGMGAPGPRMNVDLGSGSGTLTGQLKGAGVFDTVNARINGTITPKETTLTASASLIGKADLTFKGPMANFFSIGRGVSLAASIDNPNFASALADKVGGLVGGSGLFSKAADVMSLGSPYPTIRHADLSLTLGGSNPGGTMRVTGSIFGQSFTTGGVDVNMGDLSRPDEIASKVAPKVASEAMGKLAVLIEDFFSNPLTFLSGVAGRLGGDFTKAFSGGTAVFSTVGSFISCIFSSCKGQRPPDQPSPCTPQMIGQPNLLRHGDPLVFRMNNGRYYAGYRDEWQGSDGAMKTILVSERRGDSKSCLSPENAILSGDYVNVTVMDLQLRVLRRMKGQFYTENYEHTANTPYFAGASLIRFAECGSTENNNWSSCDKWTVNQAENMVVFRHPKLLPTQKTQIAPPYAPKRSLNIFYGQPVLIDGARGWESAGGPVSASEMGIAALAFVPIPGTPVHGQTILANNVPITPVTHNDRVAVLEVDLTKYSFPRDYPALLREHQAGRRAGSFGTGTGQRSAMAEDMYFVTLNETAMSEAMYAVDSGRIWLYDWRRKEWATYGTHRNINVYDVCTAVYKFPQFGGDKHPLRQAGQTCARN